MIGWFENAVLKCLLAVDHSWAEFGSLIPHFKKEISLEMWVISSSTPPTSSHKPLVFLFELCVSSWSFSHSSSSRPCITLQLLWCILTPLILSQSFRQQHLILMLVLSECLTAAGKSSVQGFPLLASFSKFMRLLHRRAWRPNDTKSLPCSEQLHKSVEKLVTAIVPETIFK